MIFGLFNLSDIIKQIKEGKPYIDALVTSVKSFSVSIWKNIKAISAWMVSNPAGWIIIATAAIGGIFKLYQKLNPSIEKQKEKIENLKTEYENINQELKSISDEIEENDKRLSELKSKNSNGTITLIEKDEINKLNRANALLREQEEIKKDLEKEASEELLKQNINTFNDEFGSNIEQIANSYNYSMYGANILSGKSLSDMDLILSIKALYAGINDAIESGDQETSDNLMEGQEYLIEILHNRSSSILQTLTDYQTILSKFMNTNGTFDDSQNQQMWNDIEFLKKEIYKQTGQSGSWNKIQLDVSLNDESIYDVQKEIEKKFSEGNLTEEDVKQYDNLNNALKNANLILEEGETPASVYLEYLRDIATTQNVVNSSSPNFNFDDSNKDKIDKYQSDLSSLSETLDKIRNGTMTSNELVDFLQEFPGLTNETDNLSYAIQNLIDDKLINLKNELRELGANDEILELFDDIANKSKNIKLNDLLSDLESSKNIIDNIKDEVSNTGSITVDNLKNIINQYPKLEESVSDYLLGKIEEKDLINKLQEEYNTDLNNYYLYIASKKGNDENFYNSIKNTLSEDLINKAKQYNIDLLNYKTYSEAKAAIDKEYELKKLRLQQAQNKYESTTNDNTRYINPSISAYDDVVNAQKDLNNIQDIIKGLNTSISLVIPKFTTSFKSGSSNSKKFSEQIDWLDNSVNNLSNSIHKLNNKLNDNTFTYNQRSNVIKDLIDKQKKLINIENKGKKLYSDQYTNSLKALNSSDRKKYKSLIESNDKITIESFNGENREKVYNAVKSAQEAWLKYQDQIQKYQEEVIKLEDLQQQQYENIISKYDNIIAIYENKKQYYQNALELKKTKGEKLNKNDFQNIIDNYNSIIKKSEKKLKDMEVERDKYYTSSTRYKELNDAIQEVQNSISQLKQEQIELNREMLKLPIQKLEESKKRLEKILEEATDKEEKLNTAINAASNYLGDQIDYYNDLKDTTSDFYDKQIKTWQDKIDLLTKTNDEIKQQIELEKAQYEYEKSINNRSVKVYREGIGFVYESDQDVVRESRRNLEEQQFNIQIQNYEKEIDVLEELKTKELEYVDSRIESLNDYKELLDDISNTYKDMAEMQQLIEIFGVNVIDKLNSGDLSLIKDMTKQLVEAQRKKASAEEQIEYIDKSIEEINSIADAWTGNVSKIKEAKSQIDDIVTDNSKELNSIIERTKTIASVSKQWSNNEVSIKNSLDVINDDYSETAATEQEILDSRLENIKNFVDKANNYLSSLIVKLDNVNEKEININTNNQQSSSQNTNSKSSSTNNDKLKKHSGMKTGFVGENLTASDKNNFRYIALNDLNPDEVPAILQLGESVLTNEQQSNIMNNMRNSFIWGTKQTSNIPKIDLPTSNSISFNGDIIIEKINGNVDEFAKKVKSEFLSRLEQQLYKQ